MTCKLCEEKLLEYLYGELSEEDAAGMEQHLEASAECRKAYEDFASVLQTVSSVDEEEEPPPALHTRIMGHAQEAGTKRRSFWAWILRPAVTTAVIGAITAGVYFTTLRHRLPGLRDERIVLEEPSSGKKEQRGALAPSGPGAKVESLGQQAGMDEALRLMQTKPSAPVEEFGAVRERREAQEKTTEPMAGISRERTKGFLEEDVMDQGSTDSLGRSEPEELGFFRAPPPSSLQSLATSKHKIPKPIARALILASKGLCEEAEEQVGAYAAKYPGEAACGTGWLEAARCYAKKENTDAARAAAKKALKTPAYAEEARAFLESLEPEKGEAGPAP